MDHYSEKLQAKSIISERVGILSEPTPPTRLDSHHNNLMEAINQLDSAGYQLERLLNRLRGHNPKEQDCEVGKISDREIPLMETLEQVAHEINMKIASCNNQIEELHKLL